MLPSSRLFHLRPFLYDSNRVVRKLRLHRDCVLARVASLNTAFVYSGHTRNLSLHGLRRNSASDMSRSLRTNEADSESCTLCYPAAFSETSPLPKSQCPSTPEEEKHRIWITAHNEHKCCGHEHRTLVLCFDGTGEQFDESSSNVVRFCSMLKKNANDRQLVYYQSGVGTFIDPLGFHVPVWPKLSLILDQMFAWNLESHIKDGYTFLMQNYTNGDKICLFGYSRGAYTARALAAMLQKVGLLPVDNHRQLQSAYDLYVKEDEHGLDLARRFKELYARPVTVEFMGLWDTVASVGITSRHLPIFEDSGIRYVRHAVALDERRIKFRPHLCYDPTPRDDLVKNNKLPAHVVDMFKVDSGTLINVEEVWFAGVHSDVGGGAFDDNELNTPRLSRIPLRWMIRQCFENSTGIVFDACMLQEVGLPVYRERKSDEHGATIDTDAYSYKLAPPYPWTPQQPTRLENPEIVTPAQGIFSKLSRLISRALFGSSEDTEKSVPDHGAWRDVPSDWEETHERCDAIRDIRCPLEANPFWWPFEIVPLSFETTLAEKLKTGDSFAMLCNKGKGRRMLHHTMPGPWKVHRSVKMRLEQRSSYAPQARPELETVRLDERDQRQNFRAKRLSHNEWNQGRPAGWKWVPESQNPRRKGASGVGAEEPSR